MRFWKPKPFVARPKIGIGVASFLNDEPRRVHTLASLVAAMQAQTYQQWQMVITHDGEAQEHVRAEVQRRCSAPNVVFVETAERKHQFGHPHRQGTIERLVNEGCEWLLVTNDDAYYSPVFLEWMLFAALNKPKCDLVYCDMVHSHNMWKTMVTKPRYRHLDLGAMLVSTLLAKKVSFNKFTFNGDGDWINRLAGQARAINKVPAVLFVHN